MANTQHAQITIFKFTIYLEKPETQLFLLRNSNSAYSSGWLVVIVGCNSSSFYGHDAAEAHCLYMLINCTYMYVYMCACVYECLCTCVYDVYVYMCTCVHVCMSASVHVYTVAVHTIRGEKCSDEMSDLHAQIWSDMYRYWSDMYL